MTFPNFRNPRESLNPLPTIGSSMATRADVTVREYGSIEDAIEARIRDREPVVEIECVPDETG